MGEVRQSASYWNKTAGLFYAVLTFKLSSKCALLGQHDMLKSQIYNDFLLAPQSSMLRQPSTCKEHRRHEFAWLATAR